MSYNVKTFGATGNGTTDDTAAIQAAINSAASAGGGIVDYPAGTYRITSALTLASYLSHKGEGVAVTKIRQDATAAHAFAGDTLEFVRFEDMMIDGPGTGTGQGVCILDPSGEAGIGMFYLTMRNVMIRQFGGGGMYVEDAVMCDLTNVTCKETGSSGFYFIGGGTSVTMTACYAHHCAGSGFRFDSMSYCALIGCGADNNENGYKTEGVAGFTFSSCGAEANSGNGWHVTSGSKAVLLNACFSNSPGSTPFKVTLGSSGITLTNPVQGDNTGTACYFIQVDSGCSKVAVERDLPGELANLIADGTS